MIDTFFLVIQQPLFNLLPLLLNINKLIVRGGVNNVEGKSRADELNLIVNERFIGINPSFQGFMQINP